MFSLSKKSFSRVWGEARTTISGLTLRTGPGTNNRDIGNLDNAQDVQILGETRISNWGPTWHKIRYWKNGKVISGWVSGLYLERKNTEKNIVLADVQGVPVDDKDGGLKLRICPPMKKLVYRSEFNEFRNKCPSQAVLPNNSKLQILGENEVGWYHVVAVDPNTGLKHEGWMKKEFVNETGSGKAIVNNVNKFLEDVDKSIRALNAIAEMDNCIIQNLNEKVEVNYQDEIKLNIGDVKKPISALEPSEHVIKLIKKFEDDRGFSEEMYTCPAGCATIGFGHKIHNGRVGSNLDAEAKFRKEYKVGKTLTEKDAEGILKRDMDERGKDVLKRMLGPDFKLTQNQFDALLCYAFNLGDRGFTTGYRDKPLRDLIKAGDHAEVVRVMQTFNVSDGVKLPGLVVRRKTEANLYMGKK